MPPRHTSCIISHLPHVAEIICTYRKKEKSDQYRNDMPPWTFMYHFAPLTCCKTISKKGRKKNEGWDWGLGTRGGGWGLTLSKVICTHGIDSQQVQWPFDLNFICSKTAGICGMNLRSTTVVYFVNECSPTGGDPSKQGIDTVAGSITSYTLVGKAFLDQVLWSKTKLRKRIRMSSNNFQ